MAKIPIENILFIDIETVPMASQYDDLDENFKSLWDKNLFIYLKMMKMTHLLYLREQAFMLNLEK